MKFFNVVLASLLGLFASMAFADNAPNWVEVDRLTTPMGPVFIYLDVANVISEDGYDGFLTKTVIQNGAIDSQKNIIVELQSIFEYNCHTQLGRAKRVARITKDGTVLPRAGIWRSVGGSPASETLEAVKRRVCFHAD
jgi:hypothetical protein